MRLLDKAVLSVALATVTACSAPPPSKVPSDSAIHAEIRALLAEVDRVQNAGDLDGFTALMADDIVLLAPDAPAVAGKVAVGDVYRSMFSQASLTIRHEPTETFVDGRLVVHRGHAVGAFHPKAGGAEVPFDNKYLYVLRRESDGRLRFVRAMFNANPKPSPKRSGP